MAWLATLFLILSTFLFSSVTAARLPPIYWNSSSEMFIGDQDPMLTVKIMDTLDIHCPFYNDTVTRDEAEYSHIYSVSEKGYENCDLDDQAKSVGMCVSPFGKESVVKLTFREFTPLPNANDYKAGRTYYFISTSNGSECGLHNRKGGLCLKSHMRLRVKVEKRDDEEAVETVEAKSGASSTDAHEISTQDDPDRRVAISKGGNVLYATGRGSSAVGKQYATGRRPPASDTTISDYEGNESSNEEAEDDDSVDVKFAIDNNLQSTPSGVAENVNKHSQADGGTNSLIYDPFGLEVGGNSVKRDRQASESWRNTKGRAGRYQPPQETILYEIHEMAPQRINRYDVNSSPPSRTSWYSVVLASVISLAVARWRHSL